MRGPSNFYPVYDFWHTSPNFFLIRVGLLLAILSVTYAWCRWGAGQWGFSPLIQLGQTSLLVYWVHIEFVYGRVSILPKHAVGIRTASIGRGGDFFGDAAAFRLAYPMETARSLGRYCRQEIFTATWQEIPQRAPRNPYLLRILANFDGDDFDLPRARARPFARNLADHILCQLQARLPSAGGLGLLRLRSRRDRA